MVFGCYDKKRGWVALKYLYYVKNANIKINIALVMRYWLNSNPGNQRRHNYFQTYNITALLLQTATRGMVFSRAWCDSCTKHFCCEWSTAKQTLKRIDHERYFLNGYALDYWSSSRDELFIKSTSVLNSQKPKFKITENISRMEYNNITSK